MRKSSATLLFILPVVVPFVLFGPFTAISPARAQDTAPPAASAPSGSGYRPAPLGVGIGAGYAINTAVDLMKPTIGSVRVVLTEQIILEPFVNLSYQSTSNEVGMASADTSSTTVGLGTAFRYTLASRGPLDFAGIAAGAFTHSSSSAPNDVHNSAQSFGLNWGFGLSWWFYSTCSLSLDATNTFLTYTRTNTDNPGAVPDTTQSTFLFGLIYNPQVTMMFHLFF